MAKASPAAPGDRAEVATTLDAHWRDLVETTFRELPLGLLIELRQVFYAGAWATVTVIERLGTGATEAEKDAGAKGLMQELHRFRSSLEG